MGTASLHAALRNATPQNSAISAQVSSPDLRKIHQAVITNRIDQLSPEEIQLIPRYRWNQSRSKKNTIAHAIKNGIALKTLLKFFPEILTIANAQGITPLSVYTSNPDASCLQVALEHLQRTKTPQELFQIVNTTRMSKGACLITQAAIQRQWPHIALLRAYGAQKPTQENEKCILNNWRACVIDYLIRTSTCPDEINVDNCQRQYQASLNQSPFNDLDTFEQRPADEQRAFLKALTVRALMNHNVYVKNRIQNQ